LPAKNYFSKKVLLSKKNSFKVFASSMLDTIHVIDFEGNRIYGILEYGLVTLKNNTIVAVSTASCREKFGTQGGHFAEHSRFPANGSDKNFKEHLPFFIKKRAEGIFCAHGASGEDRLLRQYCLTPGAIDDHSKNIPKTPPQENAESATTTVSWGPWIDTYKIYRKYYPAAQRYEVAELIRHFGLMKKLEDRVGKHQLSKELTFHRAPYDALATALLLQNFIEHFQIGDVRFLLDISV
jgi:DNA polymerase III epsilon subunit-like protein